MKLLVITQYFWPEIFRINDLVADMVAGGHEVTVLTGQPNYPSGRFFPGYGWTQPRTESYQGARIIRVPLVPRGTAGAIRLVLNYLSFAMFGALGAWLRLSGKFDAIFVFEVSPITVGIPAIVASRRFNAPILFWVLDLWPGTVADCCGRSALPQGVTDSRPLGEMDLSELFACVRRWGTGIRGWDPTESGDSGLY